MKGPYVFITGANGEIGHGLIKYLCTHGDPSIVALDLKQMDPELEPYCTEFIQGDILDQDLLSQIGRKYNIKVIYHLASILSTRAEHNPELAHKVNVDGTLNMLRLSVDQAERNGGTLIFLYPSSIAVYGLPDTETKGAAGPVDEDSWCVPQTMYGCNKLYCEHLGRYYSSFYRRLDEEPNSSLIDFRAIRFPGLISADTVPTGGTSDYGPEMLHHAAQGKPYQCFVRPDSCLPFMAMPDAIKALLLLEKAPREELTRQVYNVGSFNPSAAEIEDNVKGAFPEIQVEYVSDPGRQAIVDSWPSDVNDQAARRDWGWSPDYDQQKAFEEYLMPAIRARYKAQVS